MKKVRFILKNGENEVYNTAVYSDIIDDYLVFDLESAKIKVLLNDDFHFVRNDENGIFEIKYFDKKLESTYNLLENNMVFDLKINYFEYIIEDKTYTIKYNIESDAESIKTIILSIE